MISVPVVTDDIADAMISASQMIYASRIKGTDIISYLRTQIYHTACRISYRHRRYIIIDNKRRFSMSENKLLDLSFDFAVAIVNLVDNIHMPKSSYMTD